MGIPDDFNWKTYLNFNKDLLKQPKYSTQKGAELHWVQYGEAEKRQYKDEIPSEDVVQELLPTLVETDGVLNKIIVYTCITGKYDGLNEVLYPENNIDYVCFTDSDITSKTWEIRKIPEFLNDLDDTRKARCLKIMSNLFITGYDTSLWVDANIQIIGKVTDVIQKIPEKYNFSISKHPDRNCIYREATEIIKLNKESSDNIDIQLKKYKDENYPENYGLVQSGIILRRYKNCDFIKIEQDWWYEVLQYTKRDQLSFNYVCWKNKFSNVGILDPAIISSKYFTYYTHDYEPIEFPVNYGKNVKNYLNGVEVKPIFNIDIVNREKIPLYIFYHIGAIDDDTQSIVDEQIDLLIKSDLYDTADKIYYSIVGDKTVTVPKKFKCIYLNVDFSVAELPIMNIIRMMSMKENFKCLYFHTKGSSRNYLKTPKEVGSLWRKYLEYFNINLWKKNIVLLDSYDTVGTSLLKKETWYCDHYSGNFWWSKSDYLKNLDSVYNVYLPEDRLERFKAEMWLLEKYDTNSFNWFDYNPGLYKDTTFIKEEEYKKIK